MDALGIFFFFYIREQRVLQFRETPSPNTPSSGPHSTPVTDLLKGRWVKGREALQEEVFTKAKRRHRDTPNVNMLNVAGFIRMAKQQPSHLYKSWLHSQRKAVGWAW